MARLRKHDPEMGQKLLVSSNDHGVEMTLFRGGKRAYIHISGRYNPFGHTFSGPSTLRALAKAILREVGEGRP